MFREKLVTIPLSAFTPSVARKYLIMMKTRRNLEGKTIVVTASTKGIGFAVAERLLREGAKVVISSRKQKNVDAALEKLRAQGFGTNQVAGITCHVSDHEKRRELCKFAAEFSVDGKIDGLVSNAAVQPMSGPTLEMPEGVYDKIFDVNVKSYWQLVKVNCILAYPNEFVLIGAVRSVGLRWFD